MLGEAAPIMEQGLKLMRNLGMNSAVPIEVYGPERHMTRIVPLALEGALNEQNVNNKLRSF